MARRSLRPQLNQIRSWVREGRTDAWIAHQLEVAPRDIAAFKREHELSPEDAAAEDGGGEVAGPLLEDERDMRAEDDALVAAELDAMDEAEDTDSADDDDPGSGDGDDGDSDSDGEGDDRPRRRRGRRGGRRRRGGGRGPLEGTFDHGEEGYGLWLDPAVQDDAVYAEHWAGHRPVTVTVEPDRLVIRRRDDEGAGGDGSDSGSDS